MNLRESHKEALSKFKQANLEKDNGNNGLYKKLLKEAFELEKRAADFLIDKKEVEPTRSVLYRSAANLAILNEDYISAEKLATEGLNGNPFLELRQELEKVLADAISNLKVPELPFLLDGIPESAYLESLRNKSVELKLEESSPKFGGAVAVSNIISFLNNLQASYKNFAEISFKKIFKDADKIVIEKESRNFKSSVNLLAVNLNFQSFGISVAADEGLMERFVNHTKGFKEMRGQLFTDFKRDVILPNYEDESFKNRISEKYSEEERSAIFSPILVSASKKEYDIIVTKDNYTSRIKSFSNLSENTKKFLKPAIENKPDIEKTLVLTQTVIEKIGNKTTTLQQEQLKKFEKEVTFHESSFKSKKVIFTDPYVIQVFFEEGYYSINDSRYKIDISDSSYERIINSYHAEFIQKYDKLLDEKKQLSDDDIQLLDDFESIGLRNW